MFPNSQDALPLPLRPNLERYKKLAKDLTKVCKSVDPDVIGDWAERAPERHVPVNKPIDDLLREYGSVPEPTWYWFGEKPSRTHKS